MFQFMEAGSGGRKSNINPRATVSYDVNIVYVVCCWVVCVTTMSARACTRQPRRQRQAAVTVWRVSTVR
jgi:hypothetical protein